MKVKCINVDDIYDYGIVLGNIYEAQFHNDKIYKINGLTYYKYRFEIVEEERKMPNKEKLQKQLAQLQKTIDDSQKQAEQIRQELNKPEYKALFDLSDSCQTYVLSSRNVYPNQEMANAYDKAFKTFIELRKCQGTEPANNNKQYFISPRFHLGKSVCIYANDISNKSSEISPTFDTEDNLKAAIERVGEQNILNMFKTFHGVK